MKKKNVETQVITIMMAASMAASICPAIPALAVTKNQVAADGHLHKNSTRYKNRRGCR
ncbi:MAG: hypothetical protein V8R41_11550 [Dorea formicigenerans]